MPAGKHWLRFLFVNAAFAAYAAAIAYSLQMTQIKTNWPMYRCNPLYMGLADNVEENFVYCVQNMQSHFMGYLLQPLTYVTGSLTDTMGGFATDIQNIRAMFHKVRTFFSSIVESIFGVFLNLVIEFQKITIGIKDLIGKTVGIMVSLMYILDGSVTTMTSTWNGPPGQMVRAMGKCFHPDTPVRLLRICGDGSGSKRGDAGSKCGDAGSNCNNNTQTRVKAMRDICLGDVLEDGSTVDAIMQIDNLRRPEPLYRVGAPPTTATQMQMQTQQPQKQEDVLVTGSHLIFDPTVQRFVRVDECRRAQLCTDPPPAQFSCLITNTHRIPVGGHLFWDWEDHAQKHATATFAN